MDTMLHFSNDNMSTNYMTKEDIREKAPYVFYKNPTNPKVSDRYVFASTETIIDDMDKLGWKVVDCKQQKANKRSGVRSFHMVAFQNPNIFITKDNGGDKVIDCYPRIILTNSHDGFNSFKFMVGLFRLVCSNGLVIATDKFADVSIRHINYTFEELRQVVATAIKNASEQVQVMNIMQNVTLTEDEMERFTRDALKIRNKGNEVNASQEEIKEILKPVRVEDEDNSLWTVFNRIQERILKGSYSLMSGKSGKLRKARAITGVSRDIQINQDLFRMAMSYQAA